MLNHIPVALFSKFSDHFSKGLSGLLGFSPKHFPKSVQQRVDFFRERYGESTPQRQFRYCIVKLASTALPYSSRQCAVGSVLCMYLGKLWYTLPQVWHVLGNSGICANIGKCLDEFQEFFVVISCSHLFQMMLRVLPLDSFPP